MIHIISAPPAATSLDGTSALIEGRLQFDSYAHDQLTARRVSRAIRNLLAPPGGENFSGPLSDGTLIDITEINNEFDSPYEVGGVGYLNRSILDASGFYTEGP